MKPAPIPENEKARQDSLERMAILSTPRETDLDRIVELARTLFRSRIALFTLVDNNRQWFKTKFGLSDSETPRDISFCGHAILSDAPLIVENASEDVRFADNPLVTGNPRIRFYAGQPIRNTEGYRIGTLCLIDSIPRSVTLAEVEMLGNLGKVLEAALAVREERLDWRDDFQVLRESSDQLVDPGTGVWSRTGFERMLEGELARAKRNNTPIAMATIGIDGLSTPMNGETGLNVASAERVASDILIALFRAYDILARVNDGVFSVILPGVGEETLPVIGSRILGAIEQRGLVPKDLIGSHQMTVSIGLTSLHPETATEKQLQTMWSDTYTAMIKASTLGGDQFVPV